MEFEEDKTKLYFSEEINKQINEYVKDFENNVLLEINSIINSLIQDEVIDRKKVIDTLKNFFQEFIGKCRVSLKVESISK